MPYINIRITGNLNREQKSGIAEEIIAPLKASRTSRSLIPASLSMNCRMRTGRSPASCWMKSSGICGCSRTAGCAPPRLSRTCIAFDELRDENWVIAGKLLEWI